MNTRDSRRAAGFTLIEMVIVFALIGILVGLGLPQYKYSLIKARETVLRENLTVFRRQIDQYYQDKGKYPASLQALVQDSYLRTMPMDPMTKSSETWVEVRETPSPDEYVQPDSLGVIDVKSGSDMKSPIDGTLYSSW
ncbi:MAG: type II secretion system protein [Candidatus Aminicenantales bacterium]